MRIVEIGTGYTNIPARIGAATEIVAENLHRVFSETPGIDFMLSDIAFGARSRNPAEVVEIVVPRFLRSIQDNGCVHMFRRIVYSLKLGVSLVSRFGNTAEETVLHFHNQYNFLFFHVASRLLSARGSGKIRTAYTLHSPHWSDLAPPPLNLMAECFAIRRADLVIALTANIARNVVSLLPSASGELASAIQVIPNGVNTDVYRPLGGVKKKQIVNIGSVCPRKNQLRAIDLLAGFLRRTGFVFAYAGKIVDPGYAGSIDRFVQGNGLGEHVRYLGEIPPGERLNSVYNESMAYFSVSSSEAFSLVVLESLSAGLPLVLSESFEKSLSDLRERPGCIRIGAEESLADELEAVVTSAAYPEWCAQARAFAQAHCSWKMVGKDYLEAFLGAFGLPRIAPSPKPAFAAPSRRNERATAENASLRRTTTNCFPVQLSDRKLAGTSPAQRHFLKRYISI